MKKILLILLIFISTLWPGQQAMAHSALLETSPKNYETLDESPDKVKVTFEEPIVSHSKSIQVRSSNNKNVDLKEIIMSEDKKTLTAELGEDLVDGLYIVDINIVALDGDILKESFQFNVVNVVNVEEQTPKKDVPLELLKQAPLDGQTMEEPPNIIDLWFNQPVEITAIGLFNSEKEDIKIGQPFTNPDDPNHVMVPIEETLEKGTHQVTWYAKPVESTGYSPEKVDVFYFAVEEYTPITGDLLNNFKEKPWYQEILSLKQAGYFFIFMSMMSLFGGALLTEKIVGHYKRWNIVTYILISLLILGVALLLIAQRLELNDLSLSEFVQIKFIWLPILQCILVLFGLFIKRYRTVFFGLGLFISPFYIGHATYPKYGGILPITLSTIHVFAAAIWMGGILALLNPLNNDFKGWLLKAGPTFSKWATVSLPFIIITGVWMTIIYVPSFTISSLWISNWGKGILFKTVVTIIIFLIGYLQRRAIMNMVEKSTKLIKRRLRCEVIYIMLLMFFVSIVVISSPRAAERAIYIIESNNHHVPVEVTISPLQEGLNELIVTFEEPIIEEVDIYLTMPPDFEVSYSAFRTDETTFKISGNLIHTPGRTDLLIKAHTIDEKTYTYQYRLAVPGELSEE